MSAATASKPGFGLLLAKASDRWNRALEAGFVEAGYTRVRAAHGAILAPLFAEDGQRLGELAERGRLSKQTVTSLVEQIKRAGLISLRKDPQDGRAMRVHLTKRGRAFREVAAEVAAKVEHELMAGLEAQQREHLRGLLQSLAE